MRRIRDAKEVPGVDFQRASLGTIDKVNGRTLEPSARVIAAGRGVLQNTVGAAGSGDTVAQMSFILIHYSNVESQVHRPLRFRRRYFFPC